MKYKVLVLDLDGTLTNSKKKITDYTKKIILKLVRWLIPRKSSKIKEL